MISLGFSAKSIQSILNNEDWLNIYRQELYDRSTGLTKVETKFPKRNFINLIKPQLDKVFRTELSEKSKIIDIRGSIQRWMLIANNKSYLLIKFLNLMPNELLESIEIQKKYSDIPIGPQDSEVVKQMSPEEVKRWEEGNIALFYTRISINNLLGLFVSELFFAVEAMCRVICIGSCLEFAIKSILPNISIQHDEIFRTLKRLGNRENDKVTCKLCPINEKCTGLYAYSKVAAIYELFYHIRVIKDYRLEFYFKEGLTEFLLKEYMIKSFESACVIDNIMCRLFSGYLTSPLSLAEEKEKIFEILYKIKSK